MEIYSIYYIFFILLNGIGGLIGMGVTFNIILPCIGESIELILIFE